MGGTQLYGGRTALWGGTQLYGGRTALWGGTQLYGGRTALTAALLHPQELPSSPPPPEEDFGKGPWLTMKMELGVDERDPSCFLRTYSVVMVLRKVSSAPSHPPPRVFPPSRVLRCHEVGARRQH